MADAPVLGGSEKVKLDGDAFADVGRIRLLVIALALLFTIALVALALTLSRNADRS